MTCNHPKLDHVNINAQYYKRIIDGFSGLDKDLDQWVFHPLLFNLMSILLPT